MVDNILHFAHLTSELTVTGFIKNKIECDYEKYLCEFVNASPFFLEKSNGEHYKHTPHKSQSNGECDCVSASYELDFKLIMSKSMGEAKRILYNTKDYDPELGVTVTGSPIFNGELEVTRLHVLLRNYNLDELCNLRKNPNPGKVYSSDVRNFLKILETEKNLLLFLPYRFFFEQDCEFSEGVSYIQDALNGDFQSSMQYREFVLKKKYDTYLAFIYQDSIVFLEESNNCLNYVDSVELSKSPIYEDLAFWA